MNNRFELKKEKSVELLTTPNKRKTARNREGAIESVNSTRRQLFPESFVPNQAPYSSSVENTNPITPETFPKEHFSSSGSQPTTTANSTPVILQIVTEEKQNIFTLAAEKSKNLLKKKNKEKKSLENSQNNPYNLLWPEEDLENFEKSEKNIRELLDKTPLKTTRSASIPVTIQQVEGKATSTTTEAGETDTNESDHNSESTKKDFAKKIIKIKEQIEDYLKSRSPYSIVLSYLFPLRNKKIEKAKELLNFLNNTSSLTFEKVKNKLYEFSRTNQEDEKKYKIAPRGFNNKFGLCLKNCENILKGGLKEGGKYYLTYLTTPCLVVTKEVQASKTAPNSACSDDKNESKQEVITLNSAKKENPLATIMLENANTFQEYYKQPSPGLTEAINSAKFKTLGMRGFFGKTTPKPTIVTNRKAQTNLRKQCYN